MNVRITHIDGNLPNLALMALSAWHRAKGDAIYFTRTVERGLFPYAMLFDPSRTDLKSWQRWVNTGLYRIVPWDQYRRSTKSQASVEAFERITPKALAAPVEEPEDLFTGVA